LQEVADICSLIQQANHPCIGFCLDDSGKLRGVYPAEKKALSYMDRLVTLGDILPKSQGKLSIEEKYTLAITLTASLPQLSHTP